MRKIITVLSLGIFVATSFSPSVQAVDFIRKSEYPKFLYDAPVFKKWTEQRKVINWLVTNFELDASVYNQFPGGQWVNEPDKLENGMYNTVEDGAFDRVLLAQKEVQEQIWKKYNPSSSFSMDSNGDYLYDKNGLIGPYDAKDAQWQSKVNQWKADYTKKPLTGFGRKPIDPEAIETFAYSKFNNYKKDDGSRDLNLVKDYLKVRDTMMLYGNITNKNVFAVTGTPRQYDILVALDSRARGIFLSVLKQQYYKKGYRDIDEEIKFLLPGVFTNFSDSLTFDGKNIYEKYTPLYLTRFFNGETLDGFSTKQRKEFEDVLTKASQAIEGLRKKSKDENTFLKKVLAYSSQLDKSRAAYYAKYQKNQKDYDSFYAARKMEQVKGMLDGYVAFHSVSKYTTSQPIREYYNMASLDKDGNAVFSKKTEVVRKLP